MRTVSGNWLTNCCWALGSVATWSIWRSNLGVGTRLAAAGSSPRRCSTGTLRALAMGPRAETRARRRNLIKLGINPKEVHRASRSRKGYWRMSQNSLVRFALNNRYLKEQGVPELREIWIRLHYGDKPKSTGKAGESP